MTNEEYHDTLVRIAACAEMVLEQYDVKRSISPGLMKDMRKEVTAWKTELDRRVAPGKREVAS